MKFAVLIVFNVVCGLFLGLSISASRNSDIEYAIYFILFAVFIKLWHLQIIHDYND